MRGCICTDPGKNPAGCRTREESLHEEDVLRYASPRDTYMAGTFFLRQSQFL